MRILSLCLSAGLGGLELYALRSAVALAETESVCMVTAPEGKLRDRVLATRIEHFELQPAFRPVPILSAFRLARLIDRSKIDLIHMHWGKDLPLASLAIKLSRTKPALVYTRQMQITRAKTDAYHQFLYREMNLMLTITEQLRKRCIDMLGPNFADKVKTLYYGVAKPDTLLDSDTIAHRRTEPGLSASDFVVGLLGRLEDQKGQHLLIRAIAKAKTEGHTLKALIVGHEMNSGYRDQLVALSDELGVRDQIVFMDFVDRPQDIMQLCDCIVLATYMETFGLVLAEAMRAGVAVIGSNAGGVPEIIDHEKTGLLFEPKNVDDLEQQILKLHADPELKKQLAQEGMKKADRMFNNDHHFAALLEHFRQVIGGSK